MNELNVIFVTVTAMLGDERSTNTYEDSYAIHIGNYVVVRGYEDETETPPRAVYPAERVHLIEHLPFGKHPALPLDAAEKTQKPPRQPTGRLAPPSALPSDKEQEGAMGRFLRAAPPAESHLPERKFLQSEEASADPKVATLPLETQPEEVERRVEAASETVTFGELPLSNYLEVRNIPLSTELPDSDGVAQSPSKGKRSPTGSHKKPRPKGAALSALILPLLSLAFRHRMG